MADLSFITDEMFDDELSNILRERCEVNRYDQGWLLAIPGIYEILKEYYNNEIIQRLTDARDDE